MPPYKCLNRGRKAWAAEGARHKKIKNEKLKIKNGGRRDWNLAFVSDL
jgi:hypothetical protein